ncbi:MAG: hypothetical protein C4324_11130 [Blastocatellia bacterium]
MDASRKIETNTFGEKCRFGEFVLPYLYRELVPTEITEFEAHLAECGTCTDELADLALPRFEVFDWKRTEFDPLPTPEFSIDYNRLPKRTFISGIRGYLEAIFPVFGRRQLSFAAVILAFFAIAVWIVAIRSPFSFSFINPEIADRLPSEVAAPDIGKLPFAILPEEEKEIFATTVIAAKGDEIVSKAQKTQKSLILKRISGKRSDQVSGISRNGKSETFAVDLEIPVTGRFEKKDESIRLMDLFEEIGDV